MQNSLKFIISLGMLATLCSCNPVVSTRMVQSLPSTGRVANNVKILGLDTPVPENATLLGYTSVDEGGFTTKCSYEYVVALAQQEAANAGADLLKITAHKTPDFWKII